MRWSFGRSIKMGPLRFNLSSSGVGVSAGVRGARVSVGPRGTYVTLGRGGFRYRRKLITSAASSDAPAQQQPNATQPLDAPSGWSSAGEIRTAATSELCRSTPDAVLADIQGRLRQPNLFHLYLALSVLGLFKAAGGIAFLPLLVAEFVAGAFVWRWDRERRTARLVYDVDNPGVVERASLANGIGEALSHARGMWHVHHSVETSNWKENAGATSLIRRTPIAVRPGSLPLIEMNIEPWCIPVGPQQLLFLPDLLLVWDGHDLAGVPYDTITAQGRPIRFIEEGSVPSDARQVDTAWRFSRKDGGPDLRYKNNRQFPVMEYGELEIHSSTGLRVILQTSSPAVAVTAATAVGHLRQPAAFGDYETSDPMNVSQAGTAAAPFGSRVLEAWGTLQPRQRRTLAYGSGGAFAFCWMFGLFSPAEHEAARPIPVAVPQPSVTQPSPVLAPSVATHPGRVTPKAAGRKPTNPGNADAGTLLPLPAPSLAPTATPVAVPTAPASRSSADPGY